MNIYEWQTLGGKNEIEEYFNNTTLYEQAEYKKTRKAILENEYSAFLQLNTRQLFGKMWEIKISQNRIMYVIADSENVYFLNVFKKEKGKTEKFEIEKAINRAKRAGLL